MATKKQPTKPKEPKTIPGKNGGKLKPWPKGQSGNPKGMEPGTKHLSTWIREMMLDDDFVQKLRDGTELKGAPIKAVLQTAIAKAMSGDARMMDILFEYGWGKKVLLSDADDKPIPILGGTAARPQRAVRK